jgi:glycosyltransferase involved in cell wall biosynthesis
MTERARYGVPAGAQVVIYLGLLADYQGIPQLIQAAKTVLETRPGTYFLVFGFPGVSHYQAMAQAAGVAERVFFPGAVPYGQVPARLALGDVAVAPKLSATEGAGKILNYMAMSLPVVAFDTPVSREYLGEWGMYARFGDAHSLAQKLLNALDDPVRSRLHGQKLVQRILEEYTWEQGAYKITQVYQKVCPRPQGVL